MPIPVPYKVLWALQGQLPSGQLVHGICVANLEALALVWSPHPPRSSWLLAEESKLSLDVCLTDVNTGPELLSPPPAAGSQDRNSICLGLQGGPFSTGLGTTRPLGSPEP